MRAALRRLHSPDIDDLASYRPERPDEFGFLLQMLVGPENGPGEESFDVVVCTPRWLEKKHNPQEMLIGRHYLLVFEYDYNRLLRAIEDLCDSAEGGSWGEVASKLSRIGKWEFEDYRPF